MIARLVVTLLVACAALAALIVLEFSLEGSDTPLLQPTPAFAESNPKPRVQESRTEDLVATALANPLFSPTRRSPEQSEGTSADADFASMRLTGIVIEPDRRIAIFAATGSKPFIRSEGDMLNEWRLDRISPLEVSLSGPAGTRTVVPKPTPSLVRPGPSAQAAFGPSRTSAATGGAAGATAHGVPTQAAATAQAQRPPLMPRPGILPPGRLPTVPPLADPTRQR